MRRLFGVTVLAAVLGLGAMLAVGAAHAQTPGEAERQIPEYRLGSGDKIRVITFGEQELTGEFLVSGDGKVSLPLIGDLNAQGLTVPEFQHMVEAALKQGYLKDPKVSIEVLTYRPFYILGEVKNPGTYAYTNGLTVMNAVATAGGFTYRANTHRVFIQRQGDKESTPFSLDPQTPVAPGDTIRIPERLF
jgi:protein involved in polysaccharide export with SLBB domain